jgi:Sap, sulfolipid-1-addressing protein
MSLVITILMLGLLASLSPTTIVVFILLLATTRARLNAAAFLIGWSVSLTFVFGISYVLGGAHDTQSKGGHTAVDVVEILLGIGLAFVARREWQRRNRPRLPSGISENLTGRLKQLNPWEAAIVGFLKQPWTLTVAAAVVVVRDHTALLVAIIAFLVFTVVSTATVGLTFLYYARRPGEAEAHLSALRDRMVRAGPAIFASVSLLVGAYLVIEGVSGLVKM